MSEFTDDPTFKAIEEENKRREEDGYARKFYGKNGSPFDIDIPAQDVPDTAGDGTQQADQGSQDATGSPLEKPMPHWWDKDFMRPAGSFKEEMEQIKEYSKYSNPFSAIDPLKATDSTINYAKDIFAQGTWGALTDVGELITDATQFQTPNSIGGKSFQETFGTRGNFPYQYPESDRIVPRVVRFLAPWMLVENVALKGIVKGAEASSWLLPKIIGTNAYSRFGPKMMQFFNNSRVQEYVAGYVASYLTTGSNPSNLSTIAAEHGLSPEIWNDIAAIKEGDDAATIARKTAIENAAIQYLMNVGGPRLVAAAKTVSSAPEFARGLDRLVSKWESLKVRNPTQAQRVERAVTELGQASDSSDLQAAHDPIDYESAMGMEVPAEEKLGPREATPLERANLSGEAVDPNAPGNQAAEQLAREAEADSIVRQRLRSEKDSELKGILKRAYQNKEISHTSLMLHAYSRDFWKSVKYNYLKAGRPMSNKKINAMKTLMDNMAINFSNKTGLPAEAYYWYRFGANTYDAVRVVDDLATLSGRDVLMQGGKGGRTIVSYSPDFGNFKGGVRKHYSISPEGNVSRVDFTPSGKALNLDSTYAQYAEQHGEEAASKLLDAMTGGKGVIERVMSEHSLSKEEAVSSILRGFVSGESPVSIRGKIANDFPNADKDKLAELGYSSATKKNADSDIIHVFDDSQVTDFGFSDAPHQLPERAEGYVAPTVSEAAKPEVRAAIEATTIEARDAAVRRISDPEGLQRVVESLGPDEWVPVVRARGFASNMHPDGEFVEVTTNPKARGDKLWVRKSDIVAPSEDGFFAQTGKAVPEDEFKMGQGPAANNAAPRGAIQFDSDGRAIYTLFNKKADFSTFIHETGHLFFRDLRFMGDAPVKEMSSWLKMDASLPFDRWSVEAQEKWARAFENFISTGQAPGGMEALFNDTRQWMTQVYGPILNSPIGEQAPAKIQQFMGKVISGRSVLPIATGNRFVDQVIDITGIEDGKSADDLFERFGAADSQIIDSVTGEKMTFKRLVEEAAAKGTTLQDLLGMPLGLTPEKAWKLRCFNDASVNTIRKIADKLRSNLIDPEIRNGYMDDFKKAIAVHRSINVRVLSEARLAARALRQFGFESSARPNDYKAIKQLIENMDDHSLQEVATTIQKLEDNPEAVANLLNQIDHPKFLDAMHEFFISGLISAPATLIGNALGGISTVAHMVATTKMAQMANKIRGVQGVDAGEMNALFYGFIRGHADGKQLFKKMWDDKWIDPASAAKYNTKPLHQWTAEAFRPVLGGRELYSGDMGLFGDVIDWTGPKIRVSGRAARSTDGYFKGVIYQMEMHRLAYRTAQKKLEEAIKQGVKVSDDQVALWMHDFVSKPTVEAVLHAREAANYHTFAKGFESQAARDLTGLASAPLVRKVIPFLRIGAELYRYSLVEMTPLGYLSKDFRSRFHSPDRNTRQIARTQFAANVSTFFLLGDMYDRGYVTSNKTQGEGTMSIRQSEERTGLGNYGISLRGPDGNFYGVSKLQPPGRAVTTMIRVWELIDRAHTDSGLDLALAMVTAGVDDLTAFTQFDALTKFIDAWRSGDPNKFTSLVGPILEAHAVPYSSAVAAVERTIDPESSYTVPAQDDPWAITNGIADEIEARLPIVSRRLPKQIDLYGREVVPNGNKHDTFMGKIGGLLTPIPVSSLDKDVAKYEDMYTKINFFPDGHERVVHIGRVDVPLKPEEIEFYHRTAGSYYKGMLDDSWGDLQQIDDPGAKKATVQALLLAARAQAKSDLIEKYPRLIAEDTITPKPPEPGRYRGGRGKVLQNKFGLSTDQIESMKRTENGQQ